MPLALMLSVCSLISAGVSRASLMIPSPSHFFSKECPLHSSTAMLPLYWAPQVACSVYSVSCVSSTIYIMYKIIVKPFVILTFIIYTSFVLYLYIVFIHYFRILYFVFHILLSYCVPCFFPLIMIILIKFIFINSKQEIINTRHY